MFVMRPETAYDMRGSALLTCPRTTANRALFVWTEARRQRLSNARAMAGEKVQSDHRDDAYRRLSRPCSSRCLMPAGVNSVIVISGIKTASLTRSPFEALEQRDTLHVGGHREQVERPQRANS